ncbi:diguanylate cyclase/phosphodiesterase (GGDEF & EAL domains) with PAS/PAC sensor(s) [hydrothermal vent metagenome]|uniref:Diguanylate cyclase/phosphodiesterase (GGDEF & EAL domains) with PAS/PAC sensor(S) n=1 Tax=hydrothermal vent metagenome TaxID=652676 RepID=A0A1W1BPS1_9ZZZZ
MVMASDMIVIEIAFALLISYFFLSYLYGKIRPKDIKLDVVSPPHEEIRKSSEAYKGGVMVISHSDEILYYSKSTLDLLGLDSEPTKKSLQDRSIIKLSNREPTDIFTILEEYKKEIKKSKEYVLRGKISRDGKDIPIKILMGLIGKPKSFYIVSFTDLSDELEISASREKDQLTNLPNQNRAIHEIGIEMSKMHSEGRHFALILTSLDNFTDIRAMLGYQKTDRLISDISEYLLDISKKMDSSLYQIARNNFLLMVPDIKTSKEAEGVVKNMEEIFRGLQEYSNSQMHLTFSTGVSLYPQSGSSVDHMIDSAYKALSEAESKGRGYIVIDDNGDFSKGKHYEAELYNEMYEGLKRKEFELYYQPFVDMKSDKIVGAEALIRWNHPQRGLVPPGLFIPIAEKSGIIVDIGKFVIEEAIKQQKRWEIFKFDKLQISINLTLREIESGDVVSYIEEMLNHHQVSPASIKFEITENVAMTKADLAKKEFDALKNLGVELALDDFGTGYSSFGYLKDFSLDTIKIDQSFVMNMKRDIEHQKIVRAMIGIGHTFDLQVTAEGIEDKETYEMLQKFGCDIAQGYYFSKPIPVFEFQNLVRSR